MKTTLGTPAVVLSCLVASMASGQNTLQFTGIKATPESAITLTWASNSNEVYEIDEADSLIDTNTGTITWNTLYTDYPSQGTNTFITDAGNYDTTPEIVHPKLSPMRFYRVFFTGTNTSPTNPNVAISSPTNGAVLSGEITFTVSASSDEVLSEIKLYIDGEEQRMSDDGTNFDINTCEYLNGPHVIFATAKSQSSIDNGPFNSSMTYGRSVSPVVNVTFDNLITEFSLSQPFFEPSEGETQAVTAAFAANVNWTLEIQDINSNDVQYVTGSGTSMEYDWDGNGTNEIAIPDGVYTYLLTVATNGQSSLSQVSGGGGSSGGGTAPTPSFAVASSSSSTELYAVPAGSSGPAIPFILYPPGIDTNGLDIFEASPVDMEPLADSSSFAAQAGPMADDNTPSAQKTRAPKRKPRHGVKNKSGTFGICYKTWPVGFSMQEPLTGEPFPLQQFVAVDNFPAQRQPIPFGTLETTKAESQGLAQGLKIGGYKQKFMLADTQWSANDIKSTALGGNSIFNTCNFGWLVTHGVYGTTPEIDGVKYTYIVLFDSFNGPAYVRLSDLDLGSTGTNGLKWMTIFDCDALHPANITSMANNSKLPINDNLHLLLGSATSDYALSLFGIIYASNLVFQVSIPNSFVNTGQQLYAEAAADPNARASMTNTVTFRVMGSNPCLTDTLYQSSDPDPNQAFQIVDTTVYTAH